MSKVSKRIDRRIKELSESGCTLEDIYNIIFEPGDLIMAESPTMTRKQTVSYARAKDDIEAGARAIAAKIGGNGDYIGLFGENSVGWITAFWAILKSGNKPYLINLRQPAEWGDGILKSLDAVCVIDCDGKCQTELPCVSFEGLLKKGRGIKDQALPRFANEFALSTNGTTLKEKICFYTGREISAQLLNIVEMKRENPGLVRPYGGQIKMLAFLPLYHIFGLEAMYLWYAFFGATFVFLSDMSPETILRTVRNHCVTHIFAVPLLWHAVEKSLSQTLSAKDEKTRKKFRRAAGLSLRLQNICPRAGEFVAKRLFSEVRGRMFGDSVRFCISGGSFIKSSTLELLNSIGYPLYNGYGMSEVGITSVELSRRPKERLLGAIGRPFVSVEYRIGEQNRLLIRGSSLCRRMVVDGKEQPKGDWFDTGDIVHSDSTGRYYVSGRISDIVFGDDGENLNPDFAESGFALTQALRWAVIGTEDNSRLMLVVQIRPDMVASQKQLLASEIDACNAALPMSYRVREVKFTHDPLMDAGSIKVSRAYLRREIDAGRVRLFDLNEGGIAPESGEESEVKKILRAMFAKALGISEDEVSDTGHFMNDLGGSSLDYYTLLGDINERFGVTLDFETDRFGYTLNDFEKLVTSLVG